MEGNMFCYQCQEAAKGTGCVLKGVCGKNSSTARYMDLLLFTVRGVSVAAGWRNICIPKPSDSTTLTTSWRRTRIKTPSLKAGAISSTTSMPASAFSCRSSTIKAT